MIFRLSASSSIIAVVARRALALRFDSAAGVAAPINKPNSPLRRDRSSAGQRVNLLGRRIAVFGLRSRCTDERISRSGRRERERERELLRSLSRGHIVAEGSGLAGFALFGPGPE